MIKDAESPVANTPVDEQFRRNKRTISPDPILWARLTEEAQKERVPLVRLLDEAIKQYLERKNP